MLSESALVCTKVNHFISVVEFLNLPAWHNILLQTVYDIMIRFQKVIYSLTGTITRKLECSLAFFFKEGTPWYRFCEGSLVVNTTCNCKYLWYCNCTEFWLRNTCWGLAIHSIFLKLSMQLFTMSEICTWMFKRLTGIISLLPICLSLCLPITL